MCSEPARGSGLRTTRLSLILLSGSFESGHLNPWRASGGGWCFSPGTALWRDAQLRFWA